MSLFGDSLGQRRANDMTVNDSTIAAHLGVNTSQILASRESDGVVTVVIDKGIAGCPKYAIPLSDLTPKPAPKPKAKAAPRTRKKAAKK